MMSLPDSRSAGTKKATKAAIREVYLNGPKREGQIIPATYECNTGTEKRLRVCSLATSGRAKMPMRSGASCRYCIEKHEPCNRQETQQQMF